MGRYDCAESCHGEDMESGGGGGKSLHKFGRNNDTVRTLLENVCKYFVSLALKKSLKIKISTMLPCCMNVHIK